MKYLEHRKRYTEYRQAQEAVNEILNEWILAFQKTQPKSFTYGDKVQTSRTGNGIEDYIITVENKRIYDRYFAAKTIMEAKGDLVAITEKELRKSKSIYDIVYTAKYIDNLKMRDLYKQLDFMGISYSESQIYEIRRRIKAQIERSFDAE